MAISHLNERSAALLSHINAIGKLTISHVNGISAGFGVSYDTDAQSFFTATGITDTTQKNAVNQLVLDLKSYGIWTKMTAIYPFVGGDATKHSYNLKNPAAFQIVWAGTIVHDANGFTGNGTTGYGNTGITPSTHLTEDDTHMSIYSRTSASTASYDMGCNDASNNQMLMRIRTGSDTFQFICYASGTPLNATGNTDAQGFYIGTRRANNDAESYKNGSTAISDSSSDATTRPALAMYICCRNNNGTPAGFTSRNYALATVGLKLTDTEAANFHTAVQAFQAALGRAVTVSDSDAQLFIDAAGITDATQKNAINQLVINLKTASLWTKMRAIYPFVGGTAAAHKWKWNLKDPRDLDGAFRILWTGGVTHNANGVTPNGSTGYGDTRFNGSIQGLNDNSHLSIYIRTDTAAGDKADIVGYDGGNSYWGIKAKDTGNVTFNGLYRFVTDGFISVAGNTDSKGFYINSRRGALDGESYKNGVSTGTCGDSTQNIPNIFVHIGKRSDTLTSYSDRNYAFASIGTGLTDTEAADFYNIVQAFETDLGRQI
jgi:hypothetical protein